MRDLTLIGILVFLAGVVGIILIGFTTVSFTAMIALVVVVLGILGFLQLGKWMGLWEYEPVPDPSKAEEMREIRREENENGNEKPDDLAWHSFSSVEFNGERCEECGAEIPSYSKYCKECGASQT